MNIAENEKKILKFWQEKKLFEKSLAKESPKGDYVFYDGPPFATGLPHYGHIAQSLIKDIVPRHFTMRGYHVERKWGWDCHGLPIENIVEAEIGSKSKDDIENFGIDKFNTSCRSKVMTYADEWQKVIDRFGRWVNMDSCYKTMNKDYMESMWWVFKQLWDKDLIYEGHKAMHICPRCETTLSQSEVSQGYKDVKDISVTSEFELESEPGTFLLAWTTTPWTLPGNVALAVNPEMDYVKVRVESMNSVNRDLHKPGDQDKKIPDQDMKTENYIVAKELLEKVFDGDKTVLLGELKDGKYTNVVDEFKGKELEGKKYKPLFDYYLEKDLKNKENLYTIQLADFVTAEDGTGIVHIAPAFGDDDMRLGKEKNLPFIQHVGFDGRIKEEVTDFVGKDLSPRAKNKANEPREIDFDIRNFLEVKGLLFGWKKYEHSYPHCWRCDSPLLNYATSSWFVKVSAIKDKMLENAKKINWTPKHIKDGRFGNWLEGARDWSISRQRYWGSVMPVWKCEKCGELKVVGSIEELKELSGVEVDDLHKHVVDEVKFGCGKCDPSTGSGQVGEMVRIPDVLDCWFESGSMPYAQMHYPFENQEKFEKNFPAEFIAEGVDQTRCWFYYLLVISTALFDDIPFRNVIAGGIVLAEDGKKMSKKLQNYPDPMDLFDKYGSDAVRFYLASSPVMKADTLSFSEKEVDEVVKKIILILSNTLTFYQMYAKGVEVAEFDYTKLDNVLDKWIVGELQILLTTVTEGYDNYDINKASRPIVDFISDLSTWYLRRSRDRFKSSNEKDKANALMTMKFVFSELSKIMAPVMPFLAESVYQQVGTSTGSATTVKLESVHLEDWSEVNNDWIDEGLKKDMGIVREVCSLGLNERAQKQITVRQPLAKAIIRFPKLETLGDGLTSLIRDELNVEVLEFEPKAEKEVEIDIELTPELKQKGLERELVRHINNLRKNAGLTIEDRVKVYIEADEKVVESVKNILDKVLADEIENKKIETEFTKDLKIHDQDIWVGIEKT